MCQLFEVNYKVKNSFTNAYRCCFYMNQKKKKEKSQSVSGEYLMTFISNFLTEKILFKEKKIHQHNSPVRFMSKWILEADFSPITVKTTIKMKITINIFFFFQNHIEENFTYFILAVNTVTFSWQIFVFIVHEIKISFTYTQYTTTWFIRTTLSKSSH